MLYSAIGLALLSVVSAQMTHDDTVLAINFDHAATESDIACLKGLKMLILTRAYSPANGGSFDFSGCDNYNMYHDPDNFKFATFYMDPAPTTKTGSQHFEEFRQGLSSEYCSRPRIRFFYLSVLSPEKWHKNPHENVKFLEDMAHAAQSQGWTFGIRTDESNWNLITNNYNYKNMNFPFSVPLWYSSSASYGNEITQHTFMPFGGWTADNVALVLKSDNANVCRVNGNLNLLYTIHM